MQNPRFKIKFTLTALITVLLLTFQLNILTNNASAQTCQTDTQAEGLISAKSISGRFGNTSGACQTGGDVPFVAYKIPTYDDLLSTYFTQAKNSTTVLKTIVTGNATEANLNFGTTKDALIHIIGNLDISNNPSVSTKTGIIFADGNLNFRANNYTYGTDTTGTVFIVKGNINIAPSVTQIKASIINAGASGSGYSVCTAYDFTSNTCPAGLDIARAVGTRLIINGSLISLNSANPIRFRRNLTDNSTFAAEEVIQDPKYLVILRNLLSQTLQKWTEFAGDSAPAPSINCSSYNGNKFLCEVKGCQCSGAGCVVCNP